MLILLTAVLVHTAAGMTVPLVREIERVMARIEGEAATHSDEAVMPSPRAALGPVWREVAYGHPHRHTSAAVVAVWPVSKRPATAKSQSHELAIHPAIDQMAWRRHLRARGAIGQIAARVWSRGVELQRG